MKKDIDILSLVRKEKSKALESITPQMLYISPEFRKHVNNSVFSILSRKGKSAHVEVWHKERFPDGTVCDTACTDGNTIYLYTGNSLVRKYDLLANQFKAQMGLVFHECSHVLYTDFPYDMKITDRISKGEVPFSFKYLSEEDADKKRLVEKLITDDKARQIVLFCYHNIVNSVLDANNERRITEDYGDYVGSCLTLVEESLRRENRFYEDAKETLPPIAYSLNSLLQTCRFSDVLVRDEESYDDEDLKRILDFLPVIKKAIATNSIEDFYEYCAVILCGFSGIILDCLKEQEEQENKEQEQQGNEEKQDGEGEGSSKEEQEGQGDGSSSSSQGTSQGQGLPSQSGQGSSSLKGSSELSNGEGGDNGGLTEEDLNALADFIKSNMDKILEDLKKGAKDAGSTPAPKGTSSASEQSQGANQGQSQDGSSKKEAVKAKANDAEAGNDALSKVLSELAEKMAEDRVLSNMQEAFDIETVNMTSAHEGINVNYCVSRLPKNGEELKVEAEKEFGVNAVIRRITRELSQVIAEDARGGKNKGLYFGKTFEGSAAYRKDHKTFSNKKRPKDLGSLAVSILCDNSGSMHGIRLTYTQIASYILASVCENLNIPCEVAGHNTLRGTTYTVYKPYKAPKAAVMSVLAQEATCCNRDGLALLIATSQLKKRAENKKLLIVISDGQPNDTNYGGEKAAEDMQKILKDANRSGIEHIACAIGSDKDRIAHIYGENSTLDIEDLEKMPKALLKIFKKKVLE